MIKPPSNFKKNTTTYLNEVERVINTNPAMAFEYITDSFGGRSKVRIKNDLNIVLGPFLIRPDAFDDQSWIDAINLYKKENIKENLSFIIDQPIKIKGDGSLIYKNQEYEKGIGSLILAFEIFYTSFKNDALYGNVIDTIYPIECTQHKKFESAAKISKYWPQVFF